MSWFLVDDLIARVGKDDVLRHMDDDNDGEPDEAALRAIEDAVDTQLALRLGRIFPVATLRENPPTTIRALATDLALMFMGERKSEFLDQNGHGSHHAKGTRALDLLKSIQKGDARLDIDDQPTKPGNVFGGVRVPSSSSAASVTDGFIRNGSGDF